jgi:hypothetical protein
VLVCVSVVESRPPVCLFDFYQTASGRSFQPSVLTSLPVTILCVCVEGSIHTVNRRALGKTCSASSSLSVKFSPQPEMLRKVHFWGEGGRNESLCGRAFSSIIKVFRLQ